ncbi:MAG: hypothetical protein HY791_00795 [Deltaproteobacteria bacterium]|nr:hypothetical protein [Deltaproteobacteria bacterium]
MVGIKRTNTQETPRLDQQAAQKVEAVAAQRVDAKGESRPTDEVTPAFTHRLLEAARAKDVSSVKGLLTSWVQAQTDFKAISDGLLALSNFLRVFGSGEENPKLYQDVLNLDVPKDRPFDAGTLELKGKDFKDLGTLLGLAGKQHLAGEVDLTNGENSALKGLVVASSLGLATDALKVKMAGWNKMTPKLDNATVSFELGIRKMPSQPNTNFWVVSGVNKAVEWVKNLRISPEAVDWMKQSPLFAGYPREFFAYFMPPVDANGARISGGRSKFEEDVKKVKIEALSDGELYAGGPIMRVSGPPAAVEFLETNLMRLVTSWTTVSTAAAQMTVGAEGKPVAYFGPRRAPGGEDTTEAISKAAAIGGMTVSSDLLAGYLGHAITGTMEHSIVLMLKTVLKHDLPPFTAEQKKDAEHFLRATWKATDPKLTEAQLSEKVGAQLEDVLLEAHIFKEYSMKFDKAKSVALVDTSHPNIGTAGAMLAQKMIWAEKGKTPENDLNAIRVDSGNLLAQGLRFRTVFKDEDMGHIKSLATDGLLPETVKFFEKVEDELQKVQNKKLPESFYTLMKAAPESVAETDEERAEIIAMAEQLASRGGLSKSETVFSGYGAGEKIADSVNTVGRPGIVYKASSITFEGSNGDPLTVNLGKLASPDKATGPNRELVAKIGDDGKIEQWVIASPSEVSKLPNGYQRLMRTAFENGQIKVNTSNQKAVEHALQRRGMLSDAMKDGAKAPLVMTDTYKKEWLAVVAESDSSRLGEFSAYFDKMWPTVHLAD